MLDLVALVGLQCPRSKIALVVYSVIGAFAPVLTLSIQRIASQYKNHWRGEVIGHSDVFNSMYSAALLPFQIVHNSMESIIVRRRVLDLQH